MAEGGGTSPRLSAGGEGAISLAYYRGFFIFTEKNSELVPVERVEFVFQGSGLSYWR